MRKYAAALLILTCLPAAAADDFKVIKLEQDMRNIERQIQDLARQVNDLQQRISHSGDRQIYAPAAQAAPSSQWLNAANWKRVHPGMSELEVIELLGPPTTMRTAGGDARTLLYAMEIGASGFLGGSVEIRDRHVISVQAPVLR